MSLLYFLPLSAIGLSIDGLIIGPLLIGMFILGLFGFIKSLQGYQNRLLISNTSIILIFLSIFFILTNIGRNDVSSYILPLIVFFILGLIAFEAPKIWSHPTKHEKIIKNAFWILFYICIIELILSNFLYSIWSIIEASDLYSGSSNTYFNLRRIRAFTFEPSTLGKLLVLFHLLFRFYLPKINAKTGEKEIYANFFLISMTLSNAAILGVIMLEAARFLFPKKKASKVKSIRYSFKNLRILMFTMFSIFIGFYYYEVVLKMLERFGLIFVALNSNLVTGSVGFRATAIIMPIIYLSDVTGFNFWFGEGFSNFSDWLVANYGHIQNSGFAYGEPGNIFSAITLSGGLLGILIYIIFILSPFQKLNNLNFAVLIFIIFLNFTSGNITSPFYWGMVSIAYGVTRMQLVEDK